MNGNRFSNIYRPTLSSLARLQGNPQQDAEARQKAQTAAGWGAAMGPIGSVLGTAAGIGAGFIPGLQPLAPMLATAGGAIGGSLGAAAGTGISNAGEENLDPIRDRELRKQALMELLGRYR